MENKNNPPKADKRNRKTIRMKSWDYSNPSDYFVTICTQNRECLFGEIVEEEILKTLKMRLNIDIEIFNIMPNHVHFILTILCNDDDFCRGVLQYAPTGFVSPKNNLGSITRGFKSATIKRINILRDMPGNPVFQRNYYETIIRDERHYSEVYDYIISNPSKWDEDRNNPNNLKKTDILL